jgi:hypothetical protein
MSDDQLRPEAVETAVAWVREHRATFTADALHGGLRDAGYSAAEIAAAFARLEADATGGPDRSATRDRRGRAAAILIGGYFITWAVVSYLVEAPGTGTSGPRYLGLAALILGGILGLLGLASLIGVYNSSRLRQGVEGALVAVLAVPFIFLVIVAGLCVMTTIGTSL